MIQDYFFGINRFISFKFGICLGWCLLLISGVLFFIASIADSTILYLNFLGLPFFAVISGLSLIVYLLILLILLPSPVVFGILFCIDLALPLNNRQNTSKSEFISSRGLVNILFILNLTVFCYTVIQICSLYSMTAHGTFLSLLFIFIITLIYIKNQNFDKKNTISYIIIICLIAITFNIADIRHPFSNTGKMQSKHFKTQIPAGYLKRENKTKQVPAFGSEEIKLHKISENKILILRNYYNIAEIYDIKEKEISDTVIFNDENMKFIDFSSITLDDGRVLIYGGYGKKTIYSDTALIFNPSDNSIKKIKNMYYASINTIPVLLKNGHVLILNNNIFAPETKNAVNKDLHFEVFNPETETFYLTEKIPSTNMSGRYNYHTLKNGNILITNKGKASFIYRVDKNSFEENGGYNLPYTNGRTIPLDSNNMLYINEGFIYKFDENKKIAVKNAIKGNLSQVNAILLNNGNVLITDVSRFDNSKKNMSLSLVKKYTYLFKNLYNEYTTYIYDRKLNCFRKIYYSHSPLSRGNLIKTENGDIITLSERNCMYKYTFNPD